VEGPELRSTRNEPPQSTGVGNSAVPRRPAHRTIGGCRATGCRQCRASIGLDAALRAMRLSLRRHLPLGMAATDLDAHVFDFPADGLEIRHSALSKS
jgi:hypothetical protein